MSWQRSRLQGASVRSTFALTLALVALAGTTAQAGDELERGGEQIARALVLMAVDEGVEGVERFAGGALDPELRALLASAAAHPRAEDVRAMGEELELKAELLGALLAETPGARARVDAQRKAAAALAQALNGLRGRVAQAGLDVEALTKAKAVSCKVVRERKRGPRLLIMAAQAPLLLHRLSGTRAEALATALRFFDQEPPAGAATILVFAEKLEKHPAWSAVGGSRTFAKTLRTRVDDLSNRLRRACAGAQAELMGVRTRELRLVVSGKRNRELKEAVPLVTSYRRQFKVMPDLQAHAVFGVYKDSRDLRTHFWLTHEQRWVRGGERVDPVEPIVERLLSAQDPALNLLATRAHAVAGLYDVFLKPFAEGLSDLEGLSGELAARLAGRLKRVPPDLRTACARALSERVGVPSELLGGASAGSGERGGALSDHVLAAALERGVPVAQRLIEDLRRTRDAFQKVEVTAVSLTIKGLSAEVPVSLAWTPSLAPIGRSNATWLIPPPARARPGVAARGIALRGDRIRVTAYAWEGGEVLRGEARRFPATLSLKPGSPGLDLRRVGRGRVAVRLLPPEAPRLELWGQPPGTPARLLAPGGRLTLTGRESGGTWLLLARDPRGKDLVKLPVILNPRPSVELSTPWGVKPGQAIQADVWSGGSKKSEAVTWVLTSGGGKVVKRSRGASFSWTPKQPGRYHLSASGAGSRWIPVTKRAPRLSVARTPWGNSETVSAGEGCFLRVDAWPLVIAEEVLEVRWEVAGRKARVLPHPLHPGSALRLPLRLRANAKAGKRPARASVRTARGTLEVSGNVSVGGAGKAVEIELWRGSEPLAVGGAAVALRPKGVRLATAEWCLSSPGGAVRRCVPDGSGQVEVALGSNAEVGSYELWLSGTDRAGKRYFGRKTLRVVAIEPLEVRAPKVAVIGAKVRLAAPPPRGFKGPYRVRAVGGEWTKGQELLWEVRASNELILELSDAEGRLARAALRFRGQAAKGASGPRYGIAADVRTRRIFAADYSALEAYKRKGALPATWAVLERGPLTADGVRERIFLTVPYDGEGDGRQVAYQSRRFWSKLQASARRRFEELEVAPETVFEVLNTPSPQGEETLFDEVARLVSSEGGWTFKLLGVRVRGDGLSTVREKEEVAGTVGVKLLRRGVDQRGASVAGLELPGPLGRFSWATNLPKSLTLDRSHRLVFSALSKRLPLIPKRPYPGGWQILAPHERLRPVVEVTIELAQGEERRELLRAEASGLGRREAFAMVGADVAIWLEHLGTPRSPLAGGAPRAAERYRLHLQPMSGAGVKPAKALRTDLVFEPLSPGALTNVPQRLILTLRARQQRVLPKARWPEGREVPKAVDLRVSKGDAGSDRIEALDVAGPSLEVIAVYERRASGGAPVAPPEQVVNKGEDLKVIRADGAKAPSENARAWVTRGAKALGANKLDAAESAARQGIQRDAGGGAAWGLLADVALQRGDLPLAETQSKLALGLRSSARAHLVAGRVAFLRGDFEAAAEAATAGLALKPLGRLARRLEALQLEAQ